MTDKLISFETAKLAKEKGFNLRSPAFYGCDKPASGFAPNKLIIKDWIKWSEFGEIEEQKGTMIYSAPTQSLLQKWLREVHKIIVIVFFDCSKIKNTYSTSVFKEDNDVIHTYEHETFEEALEQGLIEALKLLP